MTTKAFNGNWAFETYVRYLKSKFGLKYALETGTHIGCTTASLATIFEKVFSMEINDGMLAQARENLKDKNNIIIVKGNTGTELNKLLINIPENTRLFVYLDAHWYDYWPLLDEIKQIAERKDLIDKSIIVIDDVQVPLRPDIPCDYYKGIALSYDYVKQTLDTFLPNGYRIEYFTENPQTRAKLLIFPKELEYPH